MNKTKIWMLAILFISFFVVSCDKDDDEPAINEVQVLIEYLESTDSPYGKYSVNTDLPALHVAERVRGLNNAGKVYIVDIRAAEDFAQGHIKNAHNVAAGFGKTAIVSQTVLGNKEDYYIINYWPAAEYSDPGHISGAIQYTPRESIALNVDLKTLPTDKTIVVYCYSGQESAQLAPYLRLIGYDAKSLKYGTNGMIYDQMTKSKWSNNFIMGYEYVTSK